MNRRGFLKGAGAALASLVVPLRLGAKTDELDEVLDQVEIPERPYLGGPPWRPQSGYIALLHGRDEIKGLGYQRVHFTDPNERIYFSEAEEDWGLVDGFAILDEGGTLLYKVYFECDSRWINMRDSICITGGIPWLRREKL